MYRHSVENHDLDSTKAECQLQVLDMLNGYNVVLCDSHELCENKTRTHLSDQILYHEVYNTI